MTSWGLKASGVVVAGRVAARVGVSWTGWVATTVGVFWTGWVSIAAGVFVADGDATVDLTGRALQLLSEAAAPAMALVFRNWRREIWGMGGSGRKRVRDQRKRKARKI